MKKINGLWLPDTETHMNDTIQKEGSYQRFTRTEALNHVKDPKNAIDIGAHCGFWAMDMCKFFTRVYAFEPVAEHRECFQANLDDRCSDWTLFPYALGDKEGQVFMHIEQDNTGHTHIGDSGVPAELRTLDSFGLTDISFIKMDCEGFEYYVCLGGKETIMREKPIICLEQKPHGFYDIGVHDGVKLSRTSQTARVVSEALQASLLRALRVPEEVPSRLRVQVRYVSHRPWASLCKQNWKDILRCNGSLHARHGRLPLMVGRA